MNHHKAKWHFVIPLLALLILTRQYAGASAVKVIIDGNLPLTGPIAAFCGDYPKAFTMGVDDACKQLSIAKDTFVIDFQDNAGKPSQGVAILQKQMLNPPAIYISGVSPVSSAIAKEIGDSGIPHLLVAFDAFLCRSGPNRIRILPHYKIEGPVFVDYAKKYQAKKVFVISHNSNFYNDEFNKIIQPGLCKLGIESRRETFEFDNKDYRIIALKAAQYKPDLIMITAFSVHIYPILGALRSYGLIKNNNVLCTLDFIDLIHNKTPISELVGVPFISPPYEITASVLPAKLCSKGAPLSSTSPSAIIYSIADKKAWVKRFEQLYKKDPSYVEAYAYDSGRIVVAAYKKYGKINTESIRKVLPFYGLCGDINIDQDGDLNTKLTVANILPDGTVKVLK